MTTITQMNDLPVEKTTQTHILPIAVFICTLATLPYIYDFFLQISPSVMSVSIMRDFGVTAVGFSSISAFFFYGYTPSQLIAGLALDRFGPRILLTVATLLCAIGAFLFPLTHHVWVASLGRLLVGVGSAFTFIAPLMLLSRWFPAKYFALCAGITQLLGCFGAIFGGAPLAAANHYYGWEHTMMGTAYFGFGLTAIVYLIVRDYPKDHPHRDKQEHSPQSEVETIKQVCRKKQTWVLAAYSFFVWAPILLFGALWGVPFLVAQYGLTDTAAGGALSFMWVGIGIGSPLLGWYSDYIEQRIKPLAYSSLLGAVSAGLILILSHIGYVQICLLLFMMGLGASGQSLSFALVRDINSPKTVGTAMGVNNTAVVAGGVLQPTVGFILVMLWDHRLINGVPHYSATSYQAALLIVPICALLSFFIAQFGLIETNCKHVEEPL